MLPLGPPDLPPCGFGGGGGFGMFGLSLVMGFFLPGIVT
jgi:hypothetical protein